MECAKSGSRLEEVEMLPPRGDGVSLSLNRPVTKAMTTSLFRGTGIARGLALMLKSNTWSMIADRPEWHPEYFELSDKQQEQAFKEYFDYMRPSIIFYNRDKRMFERGSSRGDLKSR